MILCFEQYVIEYFDQLTWALFTIIVIGNCQVCTEGDVRLLFTQRVQVCLNSTWGNICNSGWDSRDASVVCRQLGLPYLGIYATSVI